MTLINRHAHIDLSSYEISWVLERDGRPVAEGVIRKPDIPPGEEKTVNLFRNLAAFPQDGEGFIIFTVRLKEANQWAPAGFELSKMQLPVPSIPGEKVADAIMDHLEVSRDNPPSDRIPSENSDSINSTTEWRYEEDGEKLYIAGGGMGGRISLVDGGLEFLDFGKGNMLTGPLKPDFFRAPTDNEQLGIAAFTGDKLKEKLLPLADRVYGRIWDRAGDNRVVRNWKIKITPEGLRLNFSLKVAGFLTSLKLEYFFRNDARVDVSLQGRPRLEMVRFGTRMVIPSRFRQVSWYGRGPGECYADRKSAAFVTVHRADADELSYEYLNPQESGNRTDVRWVSFSDGGSALTFSAVDGKTIDFSARFASREDVASAAHAHEIKKSKNLHVHIDGGQRGVGGSIPGVLHLMKKYRMKALRKYRFGYSIRRETPGAGGQ